MNLAQVDLNLLVALGALIQERNVTRAGRRVGLSQPAMSAAMGRLRHLLRDELLVRVGREFQLTPLAVELDEPLQAILSSIERTLERKTVFDPGTLERTFKVAASDYAALVILQPLIERLGRIAPSVRLELRPLQENTGRLLASRRLDLSIQPEGVIAGFPSQVLFSDPWVCAVWRGNKEVGRTLTRAQFSSLPHVRFSIGRLGPSSVERYLDSLAIERRVDVTTESFTTSPFLLRGTRLITMLQRRLGKRLQSAAEIRLLAPPLPVPKLVESMTWNPLSSADPAHAWFRGVLADVAPRGHQDSPARPRSRRAFSPRS